MCLFLVLYGLWIVLFFFNDTATTAIYTYTHSFPTRRSSDLTFRPGSDPVPIVRAVDKPTAVRVENAPSSAAESGSIRVSIDKVDALINMVGEIGRAHV